MNKERILLLADRIEQAPHVRAFGDDYSSLTGFDMSTWHCGSVGCIGGWTEQLFGDGTRCAGHWAVAELLDISVYEADVLCFPRQTINYDKITPAQAATTLRLFAETGEVDWSHLEIDHG